MRSSVSLRYLRVLSFQGLIGITEHFKTSRLRRSGEVMTIIDENSLLERIPKDVNLRFIEPYLCIVFLQGDAHHLPFIPKCFFTIISLNLLHVLKDLKNALLRLKGVLAENGTISFTMLIKNNRRADKNLKWMLQKTSGVAPKDIKQLQAVFEEIRMLKTFYI